MDVRHKKFSRRLLGGVAILLLACGAAPAPQMATPSAATTPATTPAQTPENSLAAKYPGDKGIAADPDVIFFDNFENWPSPTEVPDGSWDGMKGRQKSLSLTHVIPGTAQVDSVKVPGNHVLEIACWWIKGQASVGGLERYIGNYNGVKDHRGPGYDEVYVRYYMRLSDNYQGVGNHGANLGGRDIYQKPAARWIAMSNSKDIAKDGYFFSGVQPYGKKGATELPLGFYIYDCNKKTPWGDESHKGGIVKPGQWYCIERHMKLNSAPDKSDGCEQLWLDGKMVINVQNLQFRKIDRLKISYFSLETYYHGAKGENTHLPAEYTPDNPIAVQYDNVVIAKRYIGPVVPAKP